MKTDYNSYRPWKGIDNGRVYILVQAGLRVDIARYYAQFDYDDLPPHIFNSPVNIGTGNHKH